MMTQSAAEKRLIQIIKLLLYGFLFAPAVVTYSTVYPFLHGKVFFIEIITEILLGLYGIGLLLKLDIFPKKTKFFLTLASFIGALTLSTIFSVDRRISFWGDWSRMTGLVLYAHLFIFFIVFAGVVRTEKERLNYLRVFSIEGIILAFFAWIQRYDTTFLRAAWTGGRVGSTLDNPDFFAVFLIFVIFGNAWLALRRNGAARFLYAGGAAFATATVFITQTRGVLVGLGATLIVAVLYYVVRSRLATKLSIGGGLLAAVTLFFMSPIRNYFIKLPGFSRIFSFTLSDETAATRILTWRIALQAWLKHPVFGWGHESFYAAFNSLYNPEFVRHSFSETWFDKTHNLFLDLLSMTGIVGFCAFIAVFIFGFVALRRAEKNYGRTFVALYSFFVVAYFVSNFFEFDTPASLAALFFIFALLQSQISENTIIQEKPREPRGNAKTVERANSKPVVKVSPTAITGIVLSTLIALWFIPIKSIAGSLIINRAGKVAKEDPSQGIVLYQTALIKNTRFSEPAISEYATNLITLFDTNDRALTDYRAHYDLAMLKFKEAIARHPYDVNYHLGFAALANTLATKDASFAEQAYAVLQEAYKVNPDRQQVLLLLGETDLLRDRSEEAITWIQKAQSLGPTSPDISYRLAIAEFASGHEKEGFAQLKKAQILGMTDIGADPLLVLISVQAGKGNWQKVVELYEKAVLLEPHNAKLFAQLATAYATIGDKQKAIKATAKAITIDPTLRQDGERLIRQLLR